MNTITETIPDGELGRKTAVAITTLAKKMRYLPTVDAVISAATTICALAWITDEARKQNFVIMTPTAALCFYMFICQTKSSKEALELAERIKSGGAVMTLNVI